MDLAWNHGGEHCIPCVNSGNEHSSQFIAPGGVLFTYMEVQ